MNSLGRKLALSYGLLIVIMLALSVTGVYNFVRLGKAVDVILVNNYKSIIAAENMKEALEREDSSAMFRIAGQSERARKQFAHNSDAFVSEFTIAANNITEPGEGEIIKDIDARYKAYAEEVQRFLSEPPGAPASVESQRYFSQLEPDFAVLKKRVGDLLHVNQDALVAASARASAQSWRGQVFTGSLAIAGLLVAVIFSWRFTLYIVAPISVLTEKAKRISEGDYDQHIDIQSSDEIGQLAAEFNVMARSLRDFQKSDLWRILLEQKKADAAINSIDAPVIVTDGRGVVTKLNRAARKLFAKEPGDNGAEERPDLESFPAGEKILHAVREAVAMQRPVSTEDEAALVPIKVEGEERSFRLRTTPMRDEDGRLLGAVTLLEDVTSMREVDRLKSEFISVASGKLRGPLNSLELALYALADGRSGDLDEKQEELLDVARKNATQLDEMTSDLLELAEIESGSKQLQVEALRPIDMVRAAVDRQRSYAECKHIVIRNNVWSDLPRIIADKQGMRRIFDNLLSNAIRHTGRDGQVTIEAWERNNRVFFSIRDSGEGIPEEYLPTIFGRFVQIKGRPGGGTGLGLALVKRLIEAQDGQISVESREGEGTVFTLALPAAVQASTVGGVARVEKA
jgi:NtrC-family two-component system sensor histidine kinase KinB